MVKTANHTGNKTAKAELHNVIHKTACSVLSSLLNLKDLRV